MRLAKLNTMDGTKILANPEAVSYIEETQGDGDGTDASIVNFVDGRRVFLKMNFESAGRSLVGASK